VPTDFSACSDAAVTVAAELARRHEATLTVLHVIDINAPSASRHCGTADELMQELWSRGLAGLCHLTETLAQDRTKVRTRIIEGLPAETIVESSPNFDLLVIGRQRSKGWNLFARHTAQRVTQGAECPVVVVDGETGHIDSITRDKVEVGS
jgi:nucleotide-binding universal stress UspA family protein